MLLDCVYDVPPNAPRTREVDLSKRLLGPKTGIQLQVAAAMSR